MDKTQRQTPKKNGGGDLFLFSEKTTYVSFTYISKVALASLIRLQVLDKCSTGRGNVFDVGKNYPDLIFAGDRS